MFALSGRDSGDGFWFLAEAGVFCRVWGVLGSCLCGVCWGHVCVGCVGVMFVWHVFGESCQVFVWSVLRFV